VYTMFKLYQYKYGARYDNSTCKTRRAGRGSLFARNHPFYIQCGPEGRAFGVDLGGSPKGANDPAKYGQPSLGRYRPNMGRCASVETLLPRRFGQFYL